MPTIDDTRECINTTMRNETEPLWFPGLAEPLAEIAWERLQRDIGLNFASYGVTRLILRDPTAGREIAAYCRPRSGREGESVYGEIPVEVVAADIGRRFISSDLRFLDSQSISGSVTNQLEEALSLLNLVPTVWPTICTLVRSLHVIDSDGDETDVSFSDPSMPFSVFVSVPRTRSEITGLRIAEAILHESMHLHLTLLAQVAPLVQPQGKMYYSPWRNEQRDSEGIIQALYVFSAIRSFLTVFPTRQSAEAGRHVESRKERIDSQIEQSTVL